MSFESKGEPNYAVLTQRFMSAEQWDRSLATAQEWLSKDPENLRAHRATAQSLINLRRLEEAEPHLQKVLAGNPNDGFAHRLMSMVYSKAGKFRLADESIRKAISLNPNDAYHWHQLALMSYRQDDLITANKCAARARELNPLDANILNLAILCEPKGPEYAREKILKFEEALALDPENATIHNNIGAEYVHRLKDYAKSEESFRRALFFQPTSEIFRKNLFITVKHRDLIYRVLCTPKDWLLWIVIFFGRLRKRNLLLFILMIPLWLLVARYVFVGLIFWFALVWPLTKVYEYLTIGDIRARAGELGVRRGGFLGYRKWPVKVRLLIFAGILISFWGGLALLFLDQKWQAYQPLGQLILGIISIGFIYAASYYVGRIIRKGLRTREVRRRAKRMQNVFKAAPEREG
jgi:Flp pilus assembly protein TadD